MYPKIHLLALTGRAKTGKDTFCKLLRTQLNKNNYATRSFALADVLRGMGKSVGLTLEQMTDPSLKEVVVNYLGCSPRTFLRDAGQYLREKYGNEILLTLLNQRISTEISSYTGTKDLFIFVTDVRLPIEGDTLRKNGFHIIRMKRNEIDEQKDNSFYQHATEKDIDNIKADIVVENNAGLEELRDDAKNFLDYYKSFCCKQLDK